jgi:hypothetical protein
MGNARAVIGIIRLAEVEVVSVQLSDLGVDRCATEDPFGDVVANVVDERVVKLVFPGLNEICIMFARQLFHEEVVDDGIMRAKDQSEEQGQNIGGVLETIVAMVGQCRKVVDQGDVVYASRSHGQDS